MNKMFLNLLYGMTFLLASAPNSIAQKNNVGLFDDHGDVGNPKLPGSIVYDAQAQQYTMQGAGSNMWAAADQFHFLWKKIKGDFIISATVRFIGKGTDNHRKIGIIARDKLTTDSRYADACVHGDETDFTTV
jgi:hypothetical protein